MRRVWLIGMALCASACSVLPGSAPAATPTTAAPTAAPAAAATPTRPAPVASPSAVPKPTNTAAPSASTTKVYVGNTDGEGVYLRKTPSMGDKLDAYADGTELTVVGDDVSNEGQTWKHVKTPDGVEGYVPAMYTTDAP
ncbi:MAG: SH3 domain-containing protein [Chloroflexi bacterium]|nr:SH3 domain-containing protein [Chloroflexota bacterium]